MSQISLVTAYSLVVRTRAARALMFADEESASALTAHADRLGARCGRVERPHPGAGRGTVKPNRMND